MTWPIRSDLDKKPPMMHTTTALTAEQHDALEKMAKAEGKAMSTILREAFEMFLEAKAEAEAQEADYGHAKPKKKFVDDRSASWQENM